MIPGGSEALNFDIRFMRSVSLLSNVEMVLNR